jgi:hypothetical protein
MSRANRLVASCFSDSYRLIVQILCRVPLEVPPPFYERTGRGTSIFRYMYHATHVPLNIQSFPYTVIVSFVLFTQSPIPCIDSRECRPELSTSTNSGGMESRVLHPAVYPFPSLRVLAVLNIRRHWTHYGRFSHKVIEPQFTPWQEASVVV